MQGAETQHQCSLLPRALSLADGGKKPPSATHLFTMALCERCKGPEKEVREHTSARQHLRFWTHPSRIPSLVPNCNAERDCRGEALHCACPIPYDSLSPVRAGKAEDRSMRNSQGPASCQGQNLCLHELRRDAPTTASVAAALCPRSGPSWDRGSEGQCGSQI